MPKCTNRIYPFTSKEIIPIYYFLVPPIEQDDLFILSS